MFGYKGNRSAA